MKYDTVIIGAGMSGLAAGIRLAYFGKKTIVLDRHTIPGGLNSYYSKDGRKFDVGLHAMTNFVPKGVKKAPFTKLLSQLRIKRDDLDLVEQGFSAIDFPNTRIKFSNDFKLMTQEIADNFPDEIDNFNRLVETIRNYQSFGDDEYVSARETVESYIKNDLLVDMIFCPLMYYGSAVENDMDFNQFCIMFQSIYLEGFCRPQKGVLVIIRALIRRFRESGGTLKMGNGVKKIDVREGKTTIIELDDGTFLETENVLSSAGLIETERLLKGEDYSNPPADAGQLSYVESIAVLNKMPKELGLDETIIFFNRTDKFRYQRPTLNADPNSGVICIPNNFQFTDTPLPEGIVRFTSLANFTLWDSYTPEEYIHQKELFMKKQIEASGFGDKIQDHIVYTDTFSPTTVVKYTGHFNGAIYGSPHKQKDGTTSAKKVYICGTDQGFLGIVGSILSGISIANRYMLR